MKARAFIIMTGAIFFLGAPTAQASSQLIETLTVDSSKPAFVMGTSVLQAGKQYTLVVSGSGAHPIASGAVERFDALYLFDFGSACSPPCVPPAPQGGGDWLVVGIEGHKLARVDQSPAQQVPYDSGHIYQVTFIPDATGVFSSANPFLARLQTSGSYVIQIYGAAGTFSSTTPPVESPSGHVIETLTVNPTMPALIEGSTSVLTAGTEYTLVVSGLVTVINSAGYANGVDALYEFECAGEQCSPTHLNYLPVGVGSHLTAIDESPAQLVPYNSMHTYDVKFIPQISGRFSAQNAFAGIATTSGGFTIRIYGPASAPTTTTSTQTTTKATTTSPNPGGTHSQSQHSAARQARPRSRTP